MYWCMCWNVFRQFVVSFQKFQNYVLSYQEPKPAPDKIFPKPLQNRLAPKPWLALVLYFQDLSKFNQLIS